MPAGWLVSPVMAYRRERGSGLKSRRRRRFTLGLSHSSRGLRKVDRVVGKRVQVLSLRPHSLSPMSVYTKQRRRMFDGGDILLYMHMHGRHSGRPSDSDTETIKSTSARVRHGEIALARGDSGERVA